MLEVSVPIAHELLAQCIKQGQALVQRASLVGDSTDYEAWKAARKQWIDPTVHALEHMYGDPREAREFADAVACAEQGQRWQQQYADDLDCVKRAIELLQTLQGELAFDAHANGSLPEPAAPAIAQHAEPLGDGERDARLHEVSSRPQTHDSAPVPVREHERVAPQREVGAEIERAPAIAAELAQQQDAPAPAERDAAAAQGAPARTRRVLLAHGRDERWKEAVAHVLEQTGNDEVAIVNDHPEERARLLEQIGEQQPPTRYAIVLLTADDIGAARLESAEEPYFTTRAGQGVVFEMGFLVAALTPGRVCVLYEDGVELPCELTGISHVRLDLAGTWQPKLLLALRRAGFDYDLNRLAA